MKKAIPVVAALVVSLVSASCSLWSRGARAYPRGVVFPLKEAASLEYGGEMVGSPVTEAGRLYLATSQGLICAFDITSKKLVWQYVVLAPLASGPVLAADGLLAADSRGHLYGLDKGDGRLRWDKEVKEFEVSWLVSGRDRVYLAGKGNLVLSLASSDGSELWRFQAKAALAGPPLQWNGGSPRLLLFTEDGALQSLTLEGKPDFAVRSGKTLSGEASAEGKLVFFGSLDRTIQCFDLASRKTRWKVRLGGLTSCAPVVRGGHLYLWTAYGVLFCLNKSNGHILWWTSIASRLPFSPALVEDKIIISVSSPRLESFSLETGREAGAFDTGRELKGPPLWLEPLVLVNAYDPTTDKGRLVFLQKDVGIRLDSSKKTPQGLADEIVFMAKSSGFFQPKFEFYLIGEGREESVQKPSEQDYWSWYPDREGDFIIKVRVTDAGEKAEAEMSFRISADPAKKPPVHKEPIGPGPNTHSQGEGR